MTEDVDVDHLLIVQCPEADLVPKVPQEGDAEAAVEDQDLAPDQNNPRSTKQKSKLIITVISH